MVRALGILGLLAVGNLRLKTDPFPMKTVPACLIFCLLIFSGGAEAVQSVSPSRRITMDYDSREQLDQVLARLAPSALGQALNRVFLGTPEPTTGGPGHGAILDRLFQRVQMILDMPRPQLTITIRFHDDARGLQQAYQNLSGLHASTPAFYWQKTRTIHINSQAATLGMLAHEMAHAVIDNYFVIRPPGKIAEMLCQFVDKEVSRGNL